MSDDFQAKIRQIETAITAMKDKLGDMLSAEQMEATLRPLREEQAMLLAADGAIVLGQDATAVGAGGVKADDVGGSIITGSDNTLNTTTNHITNNVIITQKAEETAAHIWQEQPAAEAESLKPATALYLKQIIQRYRILNFKGMGMSDRIPLQLPLDEMYVPLKARIEMPEGETWARQLKIAGRRASEEEVEVMGSRMSEPQPVLTLLQKNRGLIILGDPGAGKTTFLKYLALLLALGENEALGIGQRLPILIPLSAYANALAKKDVPLDRFISSYYTDLGNNLPIDAMLTQALQQGRALFLMDGLDEVRDLSTRHLVVDRVTAFFSFQQQRGNKFILTSRIVGYREVRPSVAGLAECTLVDFDDAEIAIFVQKWTYALEKAAQGANRTAELDAQREQKELLDALQHNAGVRRLAANPLLLTILALMKRQGVTLPDRRVELYEQYVRTLLKHWNLARGLDGRSTHDLDIVETVRVLAPLALWMHETSPGVGLVKREAMRRQLEAIYKKRGEKNPEQAARQLLQDARDHAGLLVERGHGMYGFIHLTFQEYLTAVAIAQKGQSKLKPIVKVIASHISDDNWHEVTLLAIGYMGIVQQRDEAAGDVLAALIEQQAGEPGEAAILAGEAVADTWPSGVTLQCKEETVAALLATLVDTEAVSPIRRAQAGNVLARIGDPRAELMTVEEMAFCYVPAGKFWMGSEDGDNDEKPMGLVDIPYDYWIGRYPVTQAQYAVFVAADGYKNEAYWVEAMELGYWKNGRFKGRYDSNFRDAPNRYGEPFESSNHPVVRVSWYESLAYTRWLTAYLLEKRMLSSGWRVKLVSEAEWEKAARGGIEIVNKPWIGSARALAGENAVKLVRNRNPKRRYIWDTEPGESNVDVGQANYEDTGIKATSALGAFPTDLSPYGVLEMAGNVIEWTRSKFKDYPYTPDDREHPDASNDYRSRRGGSWRSSGNQLRCASRSRNFPYFRYDFIGFRVCVSPFSPDGR